MKPRAKGKVVSVEILRRRRTALWATWMLSAGRGTTEVDHGHLAARGTDGEATIERLNG